MDFLVDLLQRLTELMGGQLGWTLIALGVGVRLVFAPMIKKQMQHSKAMQELQPKLKELKREHGDDKMKFAEAQADLFKQSGVNPAAGCLPMIVQIVIFGVLYHAILQLLDRGLPTDFFIWDLGVPDVIPVDWLPIGLPGILILLAAGSQLVMSKMMMPKPVPVNKDDKPKEVEEKVDLAEDLQRMQGTMIYLFPLMFIFIGYRFPAGLSLYWAASTITALIQQYRFSGIGGLESWMWWRKPSAVEKDGILAEEAEVVEEEPMNQLAESTVQGTSNKEGKKAKKKKKKRKK